MSEKVGGRTCKRMLEVKKRGPGEQVEPGAACEQTTAPSQGAPPPHPPSETGAPSRCSPPSSESSRLPAFTPCCYKPVVFTGPAIELLLVVSRGLILIAGRRTLIPLSFLSLYFLTVSFYRCCEMCMWSKRHAQQRRLYRMKLYNREET